MLVESAGSAGLVSTASLGDDDDAGVVVVAAASALLFRLKGHIFRPALLCGYEVLIGWGVIPNSMSTHSCEQAMTFPLSSPDDDANYYGAVLAKQRSEGPAAPNLSRR